MKICKKCNIEKDIENFYKGKNICKKCYNDKRKEYRIKNKDNIKQKDKVYYENNKEKRKLYHKLWRDNNKDKIKKYINKDFQKEYYKKWCEENKEYKKQKDKEYYENNKGIIKKKSNEYRLTDNYKDNRKKYRNSRRKNDPVYKLSYNIRTMIIQSFKNAGYIKESRTFEILGISFEEFKIYLEKQFKPWMNWSNHGLYNGNFEYGWDIDHIEPLFPEGIIRTEEDIIRLNHYTNLQPLCSKINRDIKKNNIRFDTNALTEF